MDNSTLLFGLSFVATLASGYLLGRMIEKLRWLKAMHSELEDADTSLLAVIHIIVREELKRRQDNGNL